MKGIGDEGMEKVEIERGEEERRKVVKKKVDRKRK